MMAKQSKTQEPAAPTFRDRAGEAYDNARERAVEAYDKARERASALKARGDEGVGGSPLVALGGGLALGALIAALLPRTKAEDRLLGDFGGRITGGARSAFDAAKEAGREKLAELNITQEAGKGAVQNLIDGFTEAARTSGKAALESARNKG